MRFLWCPIFLATLALTPTHLANASTFNLPLNGEVQIVGDLPAPVQVSILVTSDLNGAIGMSFGGEVGQSGQSEGPFLPLQVCTGSDCFLVAGFFGCGGNVACTGDPPRGYGLPRTENNQPLEIGTFNISDSSRFLAIAAGVSIEQTLFELVPVTSGAADYLQLSIDLPDGLRALTTPIVEAPKFLLIDPTPLPASLPLFAIGLGALGLLVRKRKFTTIQ